jgi:hypothetical protein
MSCVGDSQSKCGGSERLTVFKMESPPASRIADIPGYNYSGCYTDSVNNRTLAGTFLLDDAMTVEKCASFCAGSVVMGLEYAAECYCSSVIANSSTVTSDGECNMLCKGDAGELCGAGNRLMLYRKSS